MSAVINIVVFVALVALHFYIIHRLILVERALRNVLAAIENGDDLERLNNAIQAARKVVA
ncbi:MAG: hypothetical protein IPK75_18220 [Acidobacteria bacterium]|nr:hypothetical protein [Acidobacteriota bacterium]